MECIYGMGGGGGILFFWGDAPMGEFVYHVFTRTPGRAAVNDSGFVALVCLVLVIPFVAFLGTYV